MKSRLDLTILLFIILVLSACAPTSGSEPTTNELMDTKPDTTNTDTTIPTAIPTAVPIATAVPTSTPIPTSTAVPTPTNDLNTDANGESAPLSSLDTETKSVLIGTANVTGMEIALLESFPVQVNVAISGMLPDGCTTLGPIEVQQTENTFYVTVHTTRPAGMMCTQIVSEFKDSVALDVQGLKAGTYTVNLNGLMDTFTLDTDNPMSTPDTSSVPNGLDDADMATLMELTLQQALVAQQIPDYQLLTDKENVVLSDERINPALLPNLPGINLIVMTPGEIQQKADADGDFLYLRFQEITATSPDNVRISLGNTWATNSLMERVYVSGGGFTMEYTHTSDGWQGEITLKWES